MLFYGKQQFRNDFWKYRIRSDSQVAPLFVDMYVAHSVGEAGYQQPAILRAPRWSRCWKGVVLTGTTGSVCGTVSSAFYGLCVLELTRYLTWFSIHACGERLLERFQSLCSSKEEVTVHWMYVAWCDKIKKIYTFSMHSCAASPLKILFCTSFVLLFGLERFIDNDKNACRSSLNTHFKPVDKRHTSTLCQLPLPLAWGLR